MKVASLVRVKFFRLVLSLGLGFGVGLGLVAPVALPMAHADQSELAQQKARLLKYPDRPTYQEMLAELNPWPDTNPWAHEAESQNRVMLDFLHEGPAVIAAMESAYPGAIWGPLGRDASPLGGLLDVYYTENGQPNRVAVLAASTETYRILRPGDLVNFLASAGVNFADPLNSPPFVLIDRTTYRPTSQSTQTIEAGYGEFVRRGFAPVDIVRKFNALTLSEPGVASVFEQHLIEPYFKAQEQYFTEQGSRALRPSGLMSVPFRRGAKGSFIDGLVWHDGYNALTQLADGRWVGQPRGTGSVQVRERILSQMYLIREMVHTPEFRERMRVEAQARGLEFPFPVNYKPAPVDPAAGFKRVQQSLQSVIDALPARGDQTRYYSSNGKVLADWFNSAAQIGDARVDLVSLVFFETLAQAWKRQLIGGRDFRRLVALAMARMPLTPDGLEGMRILVRDNSDFRSMLERKAWSFRAEATREIESVSRAFDIIEREVLRPLNCELNLTAPSATDEAA